MASVVRSRVPLPVLVLTGAALLVLALLLAKILISLLIGLVKLALILAAFAGIALVGLYLWRRGDVGPGRRA